MHDTRAEVPRGVNGISRRSTQRETDAEDQQTHRKGGKSTQSKPNFLAIDCDRFQKLPVNAGKSRGYQVQYAKYQYECANSFCHKIRRIVSDIGNGAMTGQYQAFILRFAKMIYVGQPDEQGPYSPANYLGDDVIRHKRPFE